MKKEKNSEDTMFKLNKQELNEYGVIRSTKVNWKKYKKLNGLQGDVDPVFHLVKHGRTENILIPGFFKTAEYIALNDDVFQKNLHPLVHYITQKSNKNKTHVPSLFNKNGKKLLDSCANSGDKSFSFSRQELEDFFTIYTAQIPWAHFIDKNGEKDQLDRIICATKEWNDRSVVIKGYFDSTIYVESNKDVEAAGVNPLVHFIKYGLKEKRVAKKESSHRQFEIDTLKAQQINWSTLRQKYGAELVLDVDPVDYYVDCWRYEDLQIDGFFDTGFYLKNYPDIKAIDMNPLFHFVTSGSNEGRKGFLDLDVYREFGHQTYDPDKKTIVIVNHESSATGAPLVGLNLGNSFASSHNVIQFVIRKKGLHEDFLSSSFAVLTDLVELPRFFLKEIIQAVDALYPISAAVCNSVETIEVLDVFSELKIPTVSLIHEFSDYTLPKGKVSNAICFADRAVVPASIIKNSIVHEIETCFGLKTVPNNIVIQPQGLLPYIPTMYGQNLSADELKQKFDVTDDQTMIVGAGYVQIRKGTDWFISTASYLNKKQPGKYKFVWAGDGFDPNHDLTYSVWLNRQIIESGLEDCFYFLEHQRTLGNLLSITDVFLLTSRMDPFPNVVIDALAAGVHVACFENSTGCAEFLAINESSSSICEYGDTYAMAQKIATYANGKTSEHQVAKSVNQALVKNKLDFNIYADFILAEIENAKNIVEQRDLYENKINDVKAFDYQYFAILDSHQRALDHYIKCSMKGIHVSNPAPNFHSAVWLHDNPDDYFGVPLASAISKGQLETHHNRVIQGLDSECKLRGAIHLHLYYEDMHPYFIDKFSALPEHFDLYITICHQESIKNVETVFSNCKFNKIEVVYTPNVGRDIIPCFSTLREQLFNENDYDVIGHFHSKKSVDNDPGFGDRWLNYLLDNLVGDKGHTNEVLSLFEDENCGLVFAADHHNVGMGDNKRFANELCDAMDLKHLEHAANFPLGTMFWARPQALSRLFMLDFSPFVQPEPLPYDGSYMHAIERLIPTVVKAEGYDIATVYAPGTSW
ncbi:rhamnan synthesis F family protein [Paraglaciecola sp. L3A3]|uniref:rhamnan synthesis F family protein n=1 Tax=Paraglaciecola sp. L3A3 TaxID=2686358 RepID=UPI00131B7514|nr:rhamnan synthesis F family protein [Paraglaciecola sp. L3A3]